MARPRLVPLKPKSEIDGIRIERVASVAPSMLLYDGVDTSNDERVVVREYFPAAIATRESGGSGVRPASDTDKTSFEDGLTRFVEHGRALYPFRHKNVVALRAMVEANGTAYLVADHVDGAPLDDLLEPGDALVVDEVDEILPGLLDGLAALHHSELLHRAVAPGAILIRRDGTPILDLPAPLPSADDVAPPSLAPYVPATWQSQSVTAADDIYALGATLYRLITGTEPTPARERLATAAAGGPDRETAGLATIAREWPANLRTTVALCIEPDMTERPNSVSQVRDILANGAPAPPNATPEPPAAVPDKEKPAASPEVAREPDVRPGPSEAPDDREGSEVKTRPATGVDRNAGSDLPRQPDDVSTVWLGSGGASPTELPRRRTAKPASRAKAGEPATKPPKADAPGGDGNGDVKSDREQTEATQPRSRAKTGRSGRNRGSDPDPTGPRSEPSFRRKTTERAEPSDAPVEPPAGKPGDDDGTPTVRVDRSERTLPPKRGKGSSPPHPTEGQEADEPPTVPVRREPVQKGEEETKPGGPKAKPKTEDLVEEEPATVPFRRASRSEEDDAPGPGEETGVIYRKGAATPVRAPSRPTMQQAAETPTEERPSGAPVVPAGLSLIAPGGLPADRWQDLVVYLHDPGLASLVAKYIHDNPAPGTTDGPQALDAQNLIVAPETPLTITPVIEDGRANPAAVTMHWHETFHRLDFRIAPMPGASPEEGVVRVFMGPILLAESPLDFTGDADTPQKIGVRGFRAPFFSYVAGDKDVFAPLTAAAAQLRAPATARAMERRDRPWDRDILPLIEQADVMFVYWSAEASRSPDLRKEWEFALELRGPEFIRLISWVDPMPAPPIELAYVPLIRLGKDQISVPT